MKVETLDIYSRQIVQYNPDKLYIFGENQLQQGSNKPGGGQAIIRGLPNAFGFCTLARIGVPWSDSQFNLNKKQIDDDIVGIQYLLKQWKYETIVFPVYGLGTGRASMVTSCPKTFLYMSNRLLEEFEFNNIQSLVPSKQF